MRMKCLAECSKISVYGSYKYYARHRKLERTEKYKTKNSTFPFQRQLLLILVIFFYMQFVFIQIWHTNYMHSVCVLSFGLLM